MYALSHAGSAAAHYDARFDSPPPLPSRSANQTLHQIQDNHLAASDILRHLRSSDPASTVVPADVKAEYEAFCDDILHDRYLRNDFAAAAETLLPPDTPFVNVPLQPSQMERVAMDTQSLERMSKELGRLALEQLKTALAPLNGSIAALTKSAKGLSGSPAVLNSAKIFVFDCESSLRSPSSKRLGIATQLREAQRVKAGVDQCLQAFQQLELLERKNKLAYRLGHGEAYVATFVNAQSAASKSDMAAFALHVAELKRLLQ